MDADALRAAIEEVNRSKLSDLTSGQMPISRDVLLARHLARSEEEVIWDFVLREFSFEKAIGTTAARVGPILDWEFLLKTCMDIFRSAVQGKDELTEELKQQILDGYTDRYEEELSHHLEKIRSKVEMREFDARFGL